MASFKKICKRKRGMRNERILRKRHRKAKKYADESNKQVTILETALEAFQQSAQKSG